MARNKNMAKKPEVIEDISRCRQVVDILSREEVLAVDCEGVSLGRDGPLTLVQVGTYSGDVYLFDIQRNKDLLKGGKLGQLLESIAIVKVIQSCANDSAALYYQFNVTLQNVFDTQVANLVIQEHQGRKLAPLLKLDVICEKYSGKKGVSEHKEDLQSEWMKMTGDLWAKRPMTEEMIQYAAGDVTAIVPEVYENQKKYLEENKLQKKFEDRVHEEIFYFIDQSMKTQRRERVDAIAKGICANINATYSTNTSINDFEEDKDEIRGLQRIHYSDASAMSPLINRLKTELIRKELNELLEKLDSEGDSFVLSWRSKARFIDYERHPDGSIREDAKRVIKKMNDIAMKDVCRKYNMNTKLSHVRQMEKETLRSLRPNSISDPSIHQVPLRLYWLLMEDDLDKKITEFQTKRREFKMAEGYYKKMKYYIAKQTSVPHTIKRKAQMLKDELDLTFGRDVIPT
ncbi:uncharacterized protein LOC125682402 isoform X2 [Ostrea edulis]|uniref:uncharacterized protein LOC125682402 isoform X2 n=1 Tax=Ostrea edulis TaxID=37623 RepID=UPI002094728F|nr:uncharacterized protein LOC125682402 isoform X2 [Ostrea edulis]